MRILAIETSCDETAVCVIETADGDSFYILGNALLSQAEKHAAFGGVFPNLAKREHQQNLVPILHEALREAGLLSPRPARLPETMEHELSHILVREPGLQTLVPEFLREHDTPQIDCIAVTHGPGLEPALWVGINFAKALAHTWQKPIVPVNHMEGHILASLVDMKGQTLVSKTVAFPAIALLVSGGHTELQLVKKIGEYELLGRTRDDAAGECFDKCARLMSLPYPGGPQISRLAEEARTHKLPPTFALPRPMIDSHDLDFSFSGLKTAVRRTLEKHGALSEDETRALAREVEDAIVDVLVKKTLAATEAHGASTIIVGGGVSANAHLRTRLASSFREATPRGEVLFPPMNLSTDNAVMIALAGYFAALKHKTAELEAIRAVGNLRL